MNRIYRIIFNRKTSTWVAVQETAKSHTKNSSQVDAVSSGFIFKKMARALLMPGLFIGMGLVSMPAYSGYWVSMKGAVATDDTPHHTWFGTGKIALNPDTEWSTASDVGVMGNSSVAVGYRAQSRGVNSIAVGREAASQADGSISLGFSSLADSTASSGIAIGRFAKVFKEKGITLGAESRALGIQSVVVGSDSRAVNQAIALGANVYAGGQGSIAIGGDDLLINNNPNSGFNDKLSVDLMRRVFAPLLDNSLDYSKFETEYINTGRVYSPSFANGLASIAIGGRSVAAQEASTAVGPLAFAFGKFSTAVGLRSFVNESAVGGLAVGIKSRSFSENTIAVGNEAEAIDKGTTAFGYSAKAVGKNSIAIGNRVAAAAAFDVSKTAEMVNKYRALNNGTMTHSEFHSYIENKVFSGRDIIPLQKEGNVLVESSAGNIQKIKAQQDAKNAIAIGNNTFAVKENSLGLGNYTLSDAENSFAIGSYTQVSAGAVNSISIGVNSFVGPSGKDSFVAGYKARLEGGESIVIGSNALSEADRSIVLGAGAGVLSGTTGQQNNRQNVIVIGTSAQSGLGSGDAIVIGSSSVTRNSSGATVNIGSSNIIGDESYNNVLVGTYSKIAERDNPATPNSPQEGARFNAVLGTGINIGRGVKYSTAIGANAQIDDKVTAGIALGRDSFVNMDNSVAIGVGSKTDYGVENLRLPGWVSKGAISIPTSVATGVISAGEKYRERRIVNVASGAVDSDAVNVAQLKTLEERFETEINLLTGGRGVRFMSVDRESQGSEAAKVESKINLEKNYTKYVKLASQSLSFAVRKKLNGEVFNEEVLKKLNEEVDRLSDTNPKIKQTTAKLNNVLESLKGETAAPNAQKYKDYLNRIKEAERDANEKLDEFLMENNITKDEIARLKEESNYDNNAAKGVDSIAIGFSAKTSEGEAAKHAIALGFKAEAKGVSSIAVGDEALANSKNVIAIGNHAGKKVNESSSGEDLILIGRDTMATGNGAIAIGQGAQANAANSIALGTGSVANDANSNTDGYKPVGNTYAGLVNNIVRPSFGQLSIGAQDDSITRRLVGLAAGLNDSDAVNVAQLKSLAFNKIELTGDSGKTTETKLDNAGGISFKIKGNADIKTTASDSQVALELQKVTTVTKDEAKVVTSGAVYSAIAAAKPSVVAGEGISVNETKSDGITSDTFTVSLNSTIKTQIEQNTADIATNKADITANAAKITANEGKIAANETAIATNKSSIDDHATKIAANTAKGNENAGKIDVNTGKIKANEDAIATKASKDLGDIDVAGKNVIKGLIFVEKASDASDALTVTKTEGDNGAADKYTIGLNDAKIKEAAGTTNLAKEYAKVDATNVSDENAKKWADKLKVAQGTIDVADTNKLSVSGKAVKEYVEKQKIIVKGNTGVDAGVVLGNKVIVEGDGTYLTSVSSAENSDGKVVLSLTDKTKKSLEKADKSLSTTDADSTYVTKSDYKDAVGIDATKWKTALGVSNIDLSYKANSTGGKTVSLADGLNFTNGTNTTAEIAESGVVKFNVKPALEGITSITNLGTTLGLSADGISVNNKKITGVLDGFIAENSKEVVNGSQLHAVKTEVEKGFNVQVNTNTADKLALGETVKFVDGKNIKLAYDAENNKVTVATTDTPEFKNIILKDPITSSSAYLTIEKDADNTTSSTGKITGLTDRKLDATNYGEGANIGRAATEGALKDIASKLGLDGQNGNAGNNGDTGPVGKDGLNGKSIVDKVQAQRDGLSGNMVYTSPEGKRLVKKGGKFYETQLVDGKIVANEAKEVEAAKVIISAVNPNDGETEGAPVAIGNVGSGLALTNEDPIAADKAKAAIGGTPAANGVAAEPGLLGAKGNALNRIVTVKDLQAVAQAGIDFLGNQEDNKTNRIHKTLGSILSIQGKLGVMYSDSNKDSYSADNLITRNDEGVLRIEMLKAPKFDRVELGQGGLSVKNGAADAVTINVTDDKPTITFAKKDNKVIGKITGLAEGKEDSDAVSYSQLKDLLKKLGLMPTAGKDGSPGVAGTPGGTGPAGKDGLDGKSIVEKVQTQRDGLSGSMVYTDESGHRLIKEGDTFYKDTVNGEKIVNVGGKFYKASDLVDKVKVGDNFYNANEIDKNGQPKNSAQPVVFTEVTPEKVEKTKIVTSAVGVDGETTKPIQITNVKSGLGLDGSTGNDGSGDSSNPKAITADAAKEVIAGDNKDGKGGLLNQSGAALNKVATVGDLQAVAQAGLDFEGNDKDAVHKPLGTKLTIKGEGVDDTTKFKSASGNIAVVKNEDSTGLDVKLSKDLKNLETIQLTKPGKDGKEGKTITIGVDDEGNATITKPGKDGADGMPVKIVTEESFKGLAGDPGKDGIDGRNGTKGLDGAATDGTAGAAGKDGLNKKDVNEKVNALRRGEAGPVVYTTAKGDRVIKGEDGKLYKPADLEGKKYVEDRGYFNATEVETKDGKLVVKDGVTSSPVESTVVDADKPIRHSLVNIDGNTKNAPSILGNLAGGKIDDKSHDAVNGSQLNSVLEAAGLVVSKDGKDGKTVIKPNLKTDEAKKLFDSGDADKPKSIVDVLVGLDKDLKESGVAGFIKVKAGDNKEPAKVEGTDSIAIGNGTEVKGNGSTALGSNSKVTADNSVALGAGSVANEANTVSVGAPGAERRVTNVADAVNPTDAVNLGQLQSEIERVNAGISSAMALTGIPQANRLGYSTFGMGVSYYRGQVGYAVGWSMLSENGKWNVLGKMNINSKEDIGIVAGVGYNWK